MTTNFDATRRAFDLPEGLIYLDGNSPGPLQHFEITSLSLGHEGVWQRCFIMAERRWDWQDIAPGQTPENRKGGA